MTTIATAVTVAIALAGAYQTKRVADKQDGIAAQGIRNQAKNQREVNARLNTTLDQTKASDGKGAQKNALDGMLAQIQGQRAAGGAGLAKRGISEQFDQMAGQAETGAVDYASTIAGLLSRVDAGTQQRQAESNLLGDFSMDAGRLGGNIQGDAFLNDLLMKGVRRDPYLDAAIGAGSAYAKGAGGGGGKGSGMTSATADSGFRFGPTG